MDIRKTGPNQIGVRPIHFQIGTIIITLGLSHHRTSLSPLFRTFLLSYVWDNVQSVVHSYIQYSYYPVFAKRRPYTMV